jgi:L-fuculose-phosphate aldolase
MNLSKKYAKECRQFAEICHRLAAKSFVTSVGGNLARRVEENVILISATCFRKENYKPGDVVFINAQGQVLEGRHKPTGEMWLYINLFKERPDVRSIIHCHPPCCCAYTVTTAPNLLMRPNFPELVMEIGPVPLVPYETPLSPKTGHNFKPFLQKYNAFLMEDHGLVLLTQRDLEWAGGLIEELEAAANSLLRAQALGPIREISRAELVEMDKFLDVRGLPRCGAPGVNASLADLYFGSKEIRPKS